MIKHVPTLRVHRVRRDPGATDVHLRISIDWKEYDRVTSPFHAEKFLKMVDKNMNMKAWNYLRKNSGPGDDIVKNPKFKFLTKAEIKKLPPSKRLAYNKRPEVREQYAKKLGFPSLAEYEKAMKKYDRMPLKEKFSRMAQEKALFGNPNTTSMYKKMLKMIEEHISKYPSRNKQELSDTIIAHLYDHNINDQLRSDFHRKLMKDLSGYPLKENPNEKEIKIVLETLGPNDIDFVKFLKKHKIKAKKIGLSPNWNAMMQYTGTKSALNAMTMNYWDMPFVKAAVLSERLKKNPKKKTYTAETLPKDLNATLKFVQKEGATSIGSTSTRGMYVITAKNKTYDKVIDKLSTIPWLEVMSHRPSSVKGQMAIFISLRSSDLKKNAPDSFHRKQAKINFAKADIADADGHPNLDSFYAGKAQAHSESIGIRENPKHRVFGSSIIKDLKTGKWKGTAEYFEPGKKTATKVGLIADTKKRLPTIQDLKELFNKINQDCQISGETVMSYTDPGAVDYYTDQIQNIYDLSDQVSFKLAEDFVRYMRMNINSKSKKLYLNKNPRVDKIINGVGYIKLKGVWHKVIMGDFGDVRIYKVRGNKLPKDKNSTKLRVNPKHQIFGSSIIKDLKTGKWKGFVTYTRPGEKKPIRVKLIADTKKEILNWIKKHTQTGHRSNPAKSNPKGKLIYDNILAIEAEKGASSLWPKEKFRHDFKKSKGKAKIFGMPDGSLRVVGNKRLWKNFNYGKEDI